VSIIELQIVELGGVVVIVRPTDTFIPFSLLNLPIVLRARPTSAANTIGNTVGPSLAACSISLPLFSPTPLPFTARAPIVRARNKRAKKSRAISRAIETNLAVHVCVSGSGWSGHSGILNTADD
jgi:hypothetical protein